MKGNAKCKNWGGLVGWGHPKSPAMSSFERGHPTSYSTFRGEVCIYMYRIWTTASYFSKVAYVNLPTCIWHPRWRWPHSNFAKTFDTGKLESLGYHVTSFAWFYVYPLIIMMSLTCLLCTWLTVIVTANITILQIKCEFANFMTWSYNDYLHNPDEMQQNILQLLTVH